MKDFVKINNREEFNILLELYDTLGWSPSKPGLIAELSDNRFPVFISHCDKYSWNYEDQEDKFSIRKLSEYHKSLGNIETIYIKMSETDINPPFFRFGPQMTQFGLDLQFSDVVNYMEREHNGSLFHIGGMPINIWVGNDDNCTVILAKIVSIKKVQIRDFKSYEEVGAMRESGEANEYGEWYWKVTVGTGGFGIFDIEEYDHRFLEFRMFMPRDWHASEFRFNISQKVDNNYMYYTIS